MNDYYKILGVAKSASQDEIKKAFRKKAHQYHPDKNNGDDKKFKEANEAYQTLSNSQKRQQYDQFGTSFNGSGGGPGAGGFNQGGFSSKGGFRAEDININFDDLGDLFNSAFGFGGGRSRGSGQSTRGADIETQMTIEFSEAVFGAEKIVELSKNEKCDKCKGNGAEPGSKINTCKTCNGRGRITQMRQTMFGAMQTETICPNCQGEGKSFEKKCSKCSGTGIVNGKTKLKIKIPAGIDHAQTIKLSGQGQAGFRGSAAGDLFVTFKIKLDKEFRREGYNLITQIPISFTIATLGDKILIKTLDGDINLKIPSGTQTGKIFKISGKGVYKLGSSSRGDLLVEVVIKTPTKLSSKQKKLLEEFEEEGNKGWF